MLNVNKIEKYKLNNNITTISKNMESSMMETSQSIETFQNTSAVYLRLFIENTKASIRKRLFRILLMDIIIIIL